DALPAVDHVPGGLELGEALAEHDVADPRHAVGEPAGAVGESGEIWLGRVLGSEVEARPRVQVSLLERTHPDVAARPQQRVIGPDIEIDLVAGGTRRLAIHVP